MGTWRVVVVGCVQQVTIVLHDNNSVLGDWGLSPAHLASASLRLRVKRSQAIVVLQDGFGTEEVLRNFRERFG